MLKFEKMLFDLRNEKLHLFTSKLIPTIPKENILGIKIPILKQMAKEYYKKDKDLCLKYLKNLPHKYLEEYILHAKILEQIEDYEFFIENLEKWLSCVNNWAVCDSFSPKIIKVHLNDFYSNIQKYITSGKPYFIRFGIRMLMNFYLDKNENKDISVTEIVEAVSKVKYKQKSSLDYGNKYYVDMMISWFFATLLAKNYEIGYLYLKNKKLESWIHNKTIQKACESYRIFPKQKEELKLLKISCK